MVEKGRGAMYEYMQEPPLRLILLIEGIVLVVKSDKRRSRPGIRAKSRV
jgi:hypothetical protein